LERVGLPVEWLPRVDKGAIPMHLDGVHWVGAVVVHKAFPVWVAAVGVVPAQVAGAVEW